VSLPGTLPPGTMLGIVLAIVLIAAILAVATYPDDYR